MRFSRFVTAGVCGWLMACGSSNHKKVLTCDAALCGPDEDADVPDGSPGGDSGGQPPDDSEAAAGSGGSPDLDGASAGAAGVEDTAGAAGASQDGAALTVVIHGNGSVAVTGAAACLSGRCNYPSRPGTRFAIEAKPLQDSRFVGWSGDCNGNTATTNVRVNDVATCVATFAVQRSVSVSVNAASGGSVLTAPDLACTDLGCSGTVDDHTTVVLTAKPASGSRFVGWTGSPECKARTELSLSIDVIADLNCQATFAKQFTLSASALGADAAVGVKTGNCDAQKCVADAGSSALFHAGALSGYRFAGWTGDAVCTGSGALLPIADISRDISCIANYAARRSATGLVGAGFSGTVAASSASPSAACGGNQCTLDAGTTATLLAPTIAGSRLTGWSGAGCSAANQNGNGITVTPTTSNVTCTANYAAGVSVTGTVVGATGVVVATSTSPGASCAAGACGIDSGGSVALTAPNLLPTYRFVNWSGDPGCAGTARSLMLGNVVSSKACKATYVQQFTIAAGALVGGSVSAKNGPLVCAGASCTVDAGTAVALAATPDAANGYHFVAWSGGGCAPGASNPLTLSDLNTRCTASFALNSFTIAALAGTNGSVTGKRADTGASCAGNSCTVNFGTSVNLAATPALNYHFVGWSGAGCAPAGSANLQLKNIDATCSAAFSIDTFAASVSASPTVAGTVGIACPAGNCTAVGYGQLVNVTATAALGWSFAGWSANCGGSTASPTGVTVTGNTACVASFRPRVTGVVAPSGAGSITASGIPNAVCVSGDPASCVVDSGGAVTLVAKAGPNAVFSGWSGDCAGNTPTTTVSAVTVPKNCSANFYELWAQSTGGKPADGMNRVVALADGTVVGLGLSLPDASRLNRLALVDLVGNTGAVGRNQVFEDSLKTGAFAALGLAVTSNQKNVIALGVHAVSKGTVQPWLHNEQEPKWESEYSYSSGVNTSAVGGEVITTADGGYAFSVGVSDPQTAVVMAHFTRLDSSGKPSFDVEFCAPSATGACLPTFPVDLLQDPATKNYVVLSQVQNATYEILLTFIDPSGAILGSSRYVDVQDLRAAQFVPSFNAESYLVVGTRTDAKANNDGFFTELSRAQKAPAFAVSIGTAAGSESLLAIARTPTGYGVSGVFVDANLGNEAWFLLLDAGGALKSQVAYSGPLAERLTAVTAVPAGGFALGGSTSSWGAGSNDLWTLRVDAGGALAFNVASGATRYATTFTQTVLTSIKTPTSNLIKTDSTATQVAAPVTSATAGFTQIAQAP